MTAINVPMYFYSKALLKNKPGETVSEQHADQHAPEHGQEHGSGNNAKAHGPDPFKPIEKTDLQEELAAQEQPGRFETLRSEEHTSELQSH